MGEILIFQRGKVWEKEEWSPKQISFYDSMGKAKRALIQNRYQLFLIHLEDENNEGIQLARCIRGMSQYYRTPIIFLAESRKYEQEAFYDIHCYDYLLKPIKEEEVIKIIYPFLVQFISREREDKLTFHVRRSVFRVNISDIVYMESGNRNVTIHFLEDSLQVPRLKLCFYATRYSDVFVQCHRSILVNRIHIKNIDYRRGYIELPEGKVEIGRHYLAQLRREFDDENTSVYNEEI